MSDALPDTGLRTLPYGLPWWVHPAWMILLTCGTTATLAVRLPDEAYQAWGVQKYLSPSLSFILFGCVAALLLGSVLFNHRQSGPLQLTFSSRDVIVLKQLQKVFMLLTVTGYALWAYFALSNGVGILNLSAVIERVPGAISGLKGMSRPVGGLTTLVQFGPLAVSLGFVLRRLKVAGRGYVAIILLAGFRTIFYAERLALLEVLLPLAVLWSLTSWPSRRRRALIRWAPLILLPIGLALFAASEYLRSWIFYQRTSDLPFLAWVVDRVAAYYATAYNNGALFIDASSSVPSLPYFSVQAFWNVPLLETVFQHPGIQGLPPDAWWEQTLANHANSEFTNSGSFLISYGELGGVALLLWLGAGLIFGRVFARMQQGDPVAVLGYAVVFVGLLELPRFTYWTLGRATPVLLGILLLARVGLSWRRDSSGDQLPDAVGVSKGQPPRLRNSTMLGTDTA